MFFIYICLFSRFTLCILFCLAMSGYQFTFMHCHFHVHMRHTNITVVMHILEIVFDKNVAKLGYAISSWSASTGCSALMLTEGAKVYSSLIHQLWASWSTFLPNIQRCLIMTQWITPHSIWLQLIKFSLICPKVYQLDVEWLYVTDEQFIRIFSSFKVRVVWCKQTECVKNITPCNIHNKKRSLITFLWSLSMNCFQKISKNLNIFQLQIMCPSYNRTVTSEL